MKGARLPELQERAPFLTYRTLWKKLVFPPKNRVVPTEVAVKSNLQLGFIHVWIL